LPLVRHAEGWYAKYAYPIIFVAPNNIVCLFAGAAGMPLRAFFAVNLAGTVFRLWIIRRFGEAFDGPIDSIVGWVGDNRLPLLVISILAVVVSIALEAKRGESEVQALTRIDTDLPGGDGDGAGGGPGDSAPAGERGGADGDR